MTRNNGKSRGLERFLHVRASEIPQALIMLVYFFLVITTFWILKPLKKALFVGFYADQGLNVFGLHFSAAQAELLAKVANMFAAFVAATIFVMLARRFRRQQLTYIFTAAVIGVLLAFLPALEHPTHIGAWTFYVFGDIYNTLMVGTFFAFLSDSVTPEKAKRIYGPVVLGGVAGGAFGSTSVATWIDSLSMEGWLWVCIGISLAIAAAAGYAARLFAADISAESETVEPAPAGNAATEGARLVFNSKYLLAIVAIVGLYEMVSTIMDFQFTSAVTHYVAADQVGSHFARVFAITNWFGLIVQLFFASFVMTRLGVGVGLLILPAAALLGSAGFLVFPILAFGSALNTLDNGFNYSINQSAKEVLYTPTSRAEKYAAKAFIDMFVQRFAKAVAVILSLGITTYFGDFSSVRWLSVVTVALLALWIVIARYAGKQFQELTTQGRG